MTNDGIDVRSRQDPLRKHYRESPDEAMITDRAITSGGAGLTTSYPGLSWNQVTHDLRIKAAVGYVPYFGQPFLPAFGRDEHGLDGINLPFLGISGTADTTAPIIETEIGMSRLTGIRELVVLSGVEHGFDLASTNDIFTWTLTFLDAEVRGNPVTQKQLSTMASVAGGGGDSVVIFYNGPR